MCHGQLHRQRTAFVCCLKWFQHFDKFLRIHSNWSHSLLPVIWHHFVMLFENNFRPFNANSSVTLFWWYKYHSMFARIPPPSKAIHQSFCYANYRQTVNKSVDNIRYTVLHVAIVPMQYHLFVNWSSAYSSRGQLSRQPEYRPQDQRTTVPDRIKLINKRKRTNAILKNVFLKKGAYAIFLFSKNFNAWFDKIDNKLNSFCNDFTVPSAPWKWEIDMECFHAEFVVEFLVVVIKIGVESTERGRKWNFTTFTIRSSSFFRL